MPWMGSLWVDVGLVVLFLLNGYFLWEDTSRWWNGIGAAAVLMALLVRWS